VTISAITDSPPAHQIASRLGIRRQGWMVLLLVWVMCGVYSAALLKRGWVPHDEGTLGQGAMRVLEGQLPHRDFDDVYTGGLNYLNAMTFRVLGTNLAAPRIVLFAVFLTWIPAVYSIASRFARPIGAGAVTLLAAAWSIPNYSAAVPSWYNLFFATFGTLAVLRYLDTEHSLWLFLAGACGGVSFLFKVSGLYFIAGVLLFLAFRERGANGSEPQPGKSSMYSVFVIGALAAFVAALLVVIRQRVSFVALLEFVAPGAALALLCMWRELRRNKVEGAARRFLALGRMVFPFLAGAVLPVLLFLVPYFRSGATSDFIQGVFILPSRRFEFAARKPFGFGPNKIAATLALAGLLVAAYRGRGRSWIARLIVTAALVTVLATAKSHPGTFASTWTPLTILLPLAVLAAVVVLASYSRAGGIPFSRQQEVFLLMSVAAVCSLIQLPFAVGIYFCYVAPLVLLALLALFSTAEHPSRFLLGSVLAFYLAFVVFLVTPGFIYIMGNYYQPDPQTQRLNLARGGGLRVSPQEAGEYEQLIPLVQQHAGASDFIYAGPDCPEVYFLAEKHNPTRTLFDFFDEPAGHTARILAAIEAHHVEVVAILVRPEFSPPMSPELVSELRREFPNSTDVGRFEVRWRP
jgi:hypothetical protein